MKTLFLSVLITVNLFPLMAQPTLNSNEMMPFGTYIEYQESDNLTLIDTTIQGSAVTWNFQNLTTGTTNADLTLTCM